MIGRRKVDRIVSWRLSSSLSLLLSSLVSLMNGLFLMKTCRLTTFIYLLSSARFLTLLQLYRILLYNYGLSRLKAVLGPPNEQRHYTGMIPNWSFLSIIFLSSNIILYRFIYSNAGTPLPIRSTASVTLEDCTGYSSLIKLKADPGPASDQGFV
jgi:hypothetical protein